MMGRGIYHNNAAKGAQELVDVQYVISPADIDAAGANGLVLDAPASVFDIISGFPVQVLLDEITVGSARATSGEETIPRYRVRRPVSKIRLKLYGRYAGANHYGRHASLWIFGAGGGELEPLPLVVDHLPLHTYEITSPQFNNNTSIGDGILDSEWRIGAAGSGGGFTPTDIWLKGIGIVRATPAAPETPVADLVFRAKLGVANTPAGDAQTLFEVRPVGSPITSGNFFVPLDNLHIPLKSCLAEYAAAGAGALELSYQIATSATLHIIKASLVCHYR